MPATQAQFYGTPRLCPLAAVAIPQTGGVSPPRAQPSVVLRHRPTRFTPGPPPLQRTTAAKSCLAHRQELTSDSVTIVLRPFARSRRRSAASSSPIAGEGRPQNEVRHNWYINGHTRHAGVRPPRARCMCSYAWLHLFKNNYMKNTLSIGRPFEAGHMIGCCHTGKSGAHSASLSEVR